MKVYYIILILAIYHIKRRVVSNKLKEKRHMKKFIALFLTMTLIFTMLGTTTVFAATQDTFSINGTNDESGTMIGGKTTPVDIMITGINPTFTFSISGNNSLYVDVYFGAVG